MTMCKNLFVSITKSSVALLYYYFGLVSHYVDLSFYVDSVFHYILLFFMPCFLFIIVLLYFAEIIQQL